MHSIKSESAPAWRFAVLALAALASSCGPTQAREQPIPITSASASAGPEPPAKPVTTVDLLHQYVEGRPEMCRWLGMHDRCDGRVASYSAEGIAARVRALEGIRSSLVADVPATADVALDRKLLDLTCQEEIFRLTELREWQRRPKFYEELFGLDAYLLRDYAPLDERVRALVKHIEAAKLELPNIRKNLTSPIPKAFVETDSKVFKGYGEYLRGDVLTLLAAVSDSALRERAIGLAKDLADEADALGKWLDGELARADDSHVLGKDRYVKLLAVQEALETPIDTLYAMAQTDLAKNKRAYEELIAKGIKPTRPKATELLTTAQKLVDTSKEFIVSKRIVTIPDGGQYSVKESPPYMRWNAAFLNSPGPFDDVRLPAFYYITLPNPSWSKKEQEEYIMPRGTLLATTVHEVFPGHFLQSLWTRKATSRVEQALQSYSFVEGWAHYTEQMMVEEGFGAESPETRLGQLSDALLRNCRFVASIGLHVKGMTVDEAALLFINECKQDKATAREQAVRGTFDPGYFAYTLGKLQILELREEVRRALGAKFELGKFHDALLAHGGPPVPILRPLVLKDLGLDPTKTY